MNYINFALSGDDGVSRGQSDRPETVNEIYAKIYPIVATAIMDF